MSQKTELTDEQRALFEKYDVPIPEHAYKAVGCPACNEYGYKGSIGVFEVTRISSELGLDISTGLERKALKEKLTRARNGSMVSDALEKAGKGIISIDEVMQLYLGRGEDW